MILVVQPHFDDAALSIGQFIAGYPRRQITVLTLFAGAPTPPVLTTFDEQSGFPDSTHAMDERTAEDDVAMAILGACTVRSSLLDNQYRNGEISVDALVPHIDRVRNLTKAERILGPLGLLHPDHVAASNAVMTYARNAGVETFLYEELPNRVLEPESVQPRITVAEERYGFTPKLAFLGTGPMDKKEAAIAAYASQQWCLDPHVVYAPERIHCLVRKELAS